MWRSHAEREARRNIVNLNDDLVTKLITRKNGTPATISDFYALRKEAALTAHVTGLKIDMDAIFNTLTRDITTTYCHGNDLRNGWSLTIDRFQSMAPLYKAHLDNVTANSMRVLLLQTRKDLLSPKNEQDQRRIQKRKKNPGIYMHHQDTPCVNKDRLTPLESDVYKSFRKIVTRKRIGVAATKAFESNYSSNAETFITSSGFRTIIDGVVMTRENWPNLVRYPKNAQSGNVLIKLRGDKQ